MKTVIWTIFCNNNTFDRFGNSIIMENALPIAQAVCFLKWSFEKFLATFEGNP